MVTPAIVICVTISVKITISHPLARIKPFDKKSNTAFRIIQAPFDGRDALHPIGGHDPKSGLAAFNEICTKFYALYPLIAEACHTKTASYKQFLTWHQIPVRDLKVSTVSEHDMVKHVSANHPTHIGADAKKPRYKV